LEYFWVKATAVSVRLRIYLCALIYTNTALLPQRLVSPYTPPSLAMMHVHAPLLSLCPSLSLATARVGALSGSPSLRPISLLEPPRMTAPLSFPHGGGMDLGGLASSVASQARRGGASSRVQPKFSSLSSPTLRSGWLVGSAMDPD
jgi:hypothetical protein